MKNPRGTDGPLNLEMVEEAPIQLDLQALEEAHEKEAAGPVGPRHFGGVETMKEHHRLDGQLFRVKRLMADGKWRTLEEIREALGRRDSEAAIGARLRNLRQAGFGAHTMDCRRREDVPDSNLHEYRVIINWKEEKQLDRPTWEQQLRRQAEADGIKGKF